MEAAGRGHVLKMLYTIVAEFRRRQYVFQVRASSPTDAVRAWADDLQTAEISDFGAPSKADLLRRLKQFGVNAADGLPGVYTWHGAISGFHNGIVLVETDDSATQS